MIQIDDTRWEEMFRNARNLLQQGDDVGAIAALEPLVAHRPNDRIARTFLAMAYSRCDQWSQAEKIYRSLISDFPDEILLRVRLATLYMQLERDLEARDLLEAVIDSKPDVREFYSTLGVIYMRLGSYDKAKRAFEHIGDTILLKALASKMEEEQEDEKPVSQPAISEPKPEPTVVVVASVPSQSALPAHLFAAEEEDEQEDDAPFGVGEHEQTWQSLINSDADVSVHTEYHELSSDFDEHDDKGMDVDESVEGAIPVVVLPPQTSNSHTKSFAASSLYVREDFPFVLSATELLSPAEPSPSVSPASGVALEDTSTPMWLDLRSLLQETGREFLLLRDGRLLVSVRDKVFVRLRDVAMLIGEPAKHIEHKRFQGKSMGQIFGPKQNPVIRVEGECQILLNAQQEGHRSSVLLAGGQVSYFREGVVLAFSQSMDWENGRVPAGIPGVEDLALDQFWGQGELILESQGPLWGIPVRPGFPLRVAYERLVGWVGELVPQIVPASQVSDAVSARAFVMFDGEGGVLLSS